MAPEKSKTDTLIRAGAIVTMNDSRDVIVDGAVAIHGGRITAVGKAGEVAAAVHATELREYPGGVLTPGLIDGHNHPQDSLLRGVLDDLGNGVERMSKYVFPFEHGITDEEARIAARATFAEMLLNGTTCFCDAGSPTPDGIGEAAAEIGIRGIIARRGNDLPGPMRSPVGGAVDEIVEASTATVERWNGAAGGRLRGAFNLDLPANVTDELAHALTAQAADRDVHLVGHLVGRVPQGSPQRAHRVPDVQRYEELGVLGANVLLAHIGWIHPQDVDAFARTATNAVHCPSQSMFGATGVIVDGSIPELVDAGVNVGVGTDAACISRFLDLVRVMYLAACAHKDARRDPLAMGAHRAFAMGTIEGARAIGWDQEIGSIETGKAADAVVWDATGVEWFPEPMREPVNNLVYSATGRSAQLVLVAGRPVVDEGTLTSIDIAEIATTLQETAPRTLGRLRLNVETHWPHL